MRSLLANGLSISLALPLAALLVLGWPLGTFAQPDAQGVKPGNAQGGKTPAVEASKEDPVHNELRALRDGILKAVNAQDMDKLLADVHPDVVATWQDAEVNRKHEGVRAYYNKMLGPTNRIVSEMSTDVAIDEYAMLYGGDTAIAFGTLKQHFKLTVGKEFDLNSRFTATMVKDDGRWKIAAFHASTSAFDNPILSMEVSLARMIGGAVGAVCGLLVGILGAWFFMRRRKAAVAP